jgi:hypothetical protein
MRHLNVNSGGEWLSVMIGSQLTLLRHTFLFFVSRRCQFASESVIHGMMAEESNEVKGKEVGRIEVAAKQ